MEIEATNVASFKRDWILLWITRISGVIINANNLEGILTLMLQALVEIRMRPRWQEIDYPSFTYYGFLALSSERCWLLSDRKLDRESNPVWQSLGSQSRDHRLQRYRSAIGTM